MRQFILDLGTKVIQKTRYKNNIIDYKPIIDSCNFEIIDNYYNGGKKIGIMLPHLVKSSGGVTSVLRLGTNLSKLGYQITYISMFNDNEDDMKKTAKFNLDNYQGKCVPLNKTNKNDFDIVVATEWRTVYRLMEFNAYKMYFVQDFEPIFFEMGERYLLSKKTYELGFHIVSLGKWNVDTIKKNCDIKGQIDYIEFPYEKTEYTFIKRDFEKIKEKRRIKVAVYVKEESKRLPVIIPLILDNLKKSLKAKGFELEIYYFGNGLPICINNGNECGKLSKSQLYNLYCECDFGMVASLTNISLVPYEMIASGLPVIEFKDGTFEYFFNKDTAILCDLSYKHLEKELLYYIENPTELDDMVKRANDSISSLSWEKSAIQFAEIISKVGGKKKDD